jgi:hypothetical protein
MFIILSFCEIRGFKTPESKQSHNFKEELKIEDCRIEIMRFED